MSIPDGATFPISQKYVFSPIPLLSISNFVSCNRLLVIILLVNEITVVGQQNVNLNYS